LTRKTNRNSTAGPYLQNRREPSSSRIEHAKKPKAGADPSQDFAALLARESKKATTYQRTEADERANGSAEAAARPGSCRGGWSWREGKGIRGRRRNSWRRSAAAAVTGGGVGWFRGGLVMAGEKHPGTGDPLGGGVVL
jgi:hypothetical protein